MIDPNSPDTDLVKIFQSKYMFMKNGDAGYGSSWSQDHKSMARHM